MRAVCYCRVSSAAQRDRDTIESQLTTLPEYIARMGWTLVKPADTYVDDGRTARAGKLDARDGFTALLRDMARGLFDVVVVVDVNRLTRSEDLAERGAILGAFQRAGVRIAAAGTGQVLDLSTSVGDLFATLQAFFAAEDNRKRSEAVRRGKLAAAQRGGKPTGRGPWWLSYDRDLRTWVVIGERAAIVHEMFERVAGGESCDALAFDLERRGVATVLGGTWHRARVRDIIRSRSPIGEFTAHARTRTIAAVPAVVSPQLWASANAALDRNRQHGLRRTQHVYLLEGLATCGVCGGPMYIRSASPVRQSHAAYVCASRLQRRIRRVEPCSAPAVRCADADARAWGAFCRELADPDLPRELAAERREVAADAHDWQRDADGYRSHLTRLDRVAEGLLARFRRGAVSEDELDRELALVNRERAAVRAQLATAEGAQGATKNAQERLQEAASMVEHIHARLGSASAEERREVFSAFVDAGGVRFEGRTIHLELWVDRPSASAEDSNLCLGRERSKSSAPETQAHRLRIRAVA